MSQEGGLLLSRNSMQLGLELTNKILSWSRPGVRKIYDNYYCNLASRLMISSFAQKGKNMETLMKCEFKN